MSIAAAHVSEFYREVASSDIVWGIRDSAGFPAPRGTGGARAMPFWSSESRALNIIQNVPAYSGFTPVAIEWSTFCERWIPGLSKDGLLIGLNWSGKSARGFDIQSLNLQHNVEALCKCT